MFKSVENGYITGFGTAGDNCTEAEYLLLQEAMRNQPTPEAGYSVRLREDLVWETYELPEPDLEDDEIVAELLEVLA